MLPKIKTLIASAATAYIGNMPDLPANAVCIYPTGGYPQDLAGSMTREPTFQIKVRNTSYATGYTLCETILDLLHGVNGTADFLLIEAQGDIMDLGRDQANRQEWSMNFRCYYTG